MDSISENIETIGSIIYELPDDTNRLDEFKLQYEKILLRKRDPNFYLSVIGDFSSGKSTLINTIMRRKLLKVAHIATTSVPTYIQKGECDHVVVIAESDDGKRYELTSDADAIEFEKDFGVSLPQQTDERISLLTADKKLALKIKEVNIGLPDDEFGSNLCIIDTPGINPGADFAAKHAEVTKQILNEKADAILVLFPAEQAYTQSFEKFLKDNAEYFMKDAIFLVTMLDIIDEEERDDIVRFVKANLRNSFYIEDPQVLSCSAKLFGKDPYWTDKFKEFERYLTDRLKQNRQRIVNERLIMLSDELLNSVQTEIVKQNSGLEQRLSVLQNHSVPNLISVLADKKLETYDKLAEIREEHHNEIINEGAYLQQKIMQRINLGLNSCNSRSGVTKYVKESLTSDMEAVCQDMYTASARHITRVNYTLSSAIAEMIEILKIYYGEIGGVLPESTSFSVTEQKTAIANKLTDLNGLIGDYETKIDIATTLGGAGLAAIILSGLGPIGWIIGGLAALIGGDRLFVDSARSKVRESVSGKIPDIAHSIVKELCIGMQTVYTDARQVLEAKNDGLVAQYQPIYEELEEQFNSEKQRLTEQIQHREKIQNRIREVLQQINKIQGGIIR